MKADDKKSDLKQALHIAWSFRVERNTKAHAAKRPGKPRG
jgi:hypothetical protein